MKRRSARGVRHRSYDSTGWWTRGNGGTAVEPSFVFPDPPELPPVEDDESVSDEGKSDAERA